MVRAFAPDRTMTVPIQLDSWQHHFLADRPHDRTIGSLRSVESQTHIKRHGRLLYLDPRSKLARFRKIL